MYNAMNDTDEKDNHKSYNDSEISSSITSAIGNAEQIIDILIEKSQEKAQKEAEQALLEYRAKINQIAAEITNNISAGSIRISESINQAIKRKVEKEASDLSHTFIAGANKKAEETAIDSPQPKDISKIDYELAKAAAELKDKTSKLNKAADIESADDPKNNGKKSSGELKKTPPEKSDEKVEDIIRFFS